MSATDRSDLAEAFERQRPYLRGLALRMLGAEADADDALQQAWLRLSRSGGDGIADLRAWLTTVTSRVCLDMLRARRARREVPVEIDLDDLAGRAGDAPTPEDEVLLAESVGLALHVVMDQLTPAERVAFVLHDVFDLPFDQVAAVLGRSTDAAKMLASRARRRLRVVAPEPYGDEPAGRALVDAFFAAAGSGDVAALLELLAPDAELRIVAARGVTVLRGAETIAANARSGAGRGAALRPVLHPITAGGAPGMLLVLAGRPRAVMTFTVREGRIAAIRSVTDPDRLARVIPAWAL
jgi:RNA polymerase sigma-70 factor (ECF subfamily)